MLLKENVWKLNVPRKWLSGQNVDNALTIGHPCGGSDLNGNWQPYFGIWVIRCGLRLYQGIKELILF